MTRTLLITRAGICSRCKGEYTVREYRLENGEEEHVCGHCFTNEDEPEEVKPCEEPQLPLFVG